MPKPALNLEIRFLFNGGYISKIKNLSFEVLDTGKNGHASPRLKLPKNLALALSKP